MPSLPPELFIQLENTATQQEYARYEWSGLESPVFRVIPDTQRGRFRKCTAAALVHTWQRPLLIWRDFDELMSAKMTKVSHNVSSNAMENLNVLRNGVSEVCVWVNGLEKLDSGHSIVFAKAIGECWGPDYISTRIFKDLRIKAALVFQIPLTITRNRWVNEPYDGQCHGFSDTGAQNTGSYRTF